ncbi:hypothetical protein K8942_03670 [Candidatus Peribacteria bacterium]|nr:MAG: hypothetical protein K8942_03670 [Candidatus Peribacteria bacterium]
MELTAEEVHAALKAEGIAVVPGLKALTDAGPSKIFSGKKEDGTVWIVRKTLDGFFFIEYTQKNAPGWNG